MVMKMLATRRYGLASYFNQMLENKIIMTYVKLCHSGLRNVQSNSAFKLYLWNIEIYQHETPQAYDHI
jgi:hypothetical protein